MTNYKTVTIGSYNKNVREFSEKFKERTDLNTRFEFQRFIELISGKNVLDLGCGSGDHSLFFKEQGFDVASIDLSEEMIKSCKAKGLNARLMDIEQLEFEDNSFDGIWAVTSLIHVPKSKLPSVAQKLNQILKKNGILYICVKEGVGERLIPDTSGNTQRFYAFFEEEEIKQLFEKYFVLLEMKKVSFKGTTYLQAFWKKKE